MHGWMARKFAIQQQGQGAFIIALLNIARNRGIPLTPKRLSRLSLIEIDPSLIDNFRSLVKQDFGIDFPKDQLFCKDIITHYHDKRYDILIGNPPWVNFAELPTAYKTATKTLFHSRRTCAECTESSLRLLTD